MILRIYTRRSKGDEHQHYSLDVQRDGARQFLGHLAGLGLRPEWDDRVEYADDDRSRTDFEGREALAKLRLEVQEDDLVVCRDQSRLGGDALEVTVAVRDIVQRRRARLFYYADRQEVPYSTVIDAAMTFVRGVGSQMEVENIRARTREALRARVKLGRLAGGRCYGYRNVQNPDPDGRRKNTVAVVDEEQAKVVRHVFEAARAGRGFKSIAGELNASGLTTPRGRRWTHGAIRTLLTCHRYRGVYIHGRINRRRSGNKRIASRAKPDEIMFVEVPEWRIVDDITWQTVQARFKERERGPRMTGPATKYALSGIARCGSCGGAVGAASRTTITINGVRSHVPAYACLAHRGKGSCPVPVAQRVDEVEGALAAFVQQHVLTPAIIDQIMEGVRDEIARQMGGPKADIVAMEQRLEKLKKEQSNLARAVATGGDAIPELLDEMRSRQRRMEELTLAIQSARRTPATAEEVLAKVETALRAKLADLRSALGGDPAGARDAYVALFPQGLTFTPTSVGKARGPARTRRVWAIAGMAHLGVCNLVVTPPGLEPGISA